MTAFEIVIPTVGRPTLRGLLSALAACEGPLPAQVIVVDDRRQPAAAPLLPGVPAPLDGRVRVIEGRAAGPAAARNDGWRASSADWVAFLDDDVEPGPAWLQQLADDLEGLPPEVGGSQGRILVPLTAGRKPTDWERDVKGLERARWATADMAYRRSVLQRVGGFDERFRRAYREDADLGLRVIAAGYRIATGRRCSLHPPRQGERWASLKRQAGNADDALMAALHGRGWGERAGAPAGRRPLHMAVTLAGAVALAGLLLKRRRLAAVAGAGWAFGTAEFALGRILPGPRTADELLTMLPTSAAIPPTATYQWLRGLLAARRQRPLPAAILFDRDGTLVEDVPYNGDPSRVRPLPGARRALDRVRRRGIPIAVVSNQSGVARGLLTEEQVEAVNRRVEELLGPIAGWSYCPHGPEEGCDCRKPAPGLITRAAALLGVDPERCAVVGDIGADVEAARAAGARAVLVPTPVTRPEEVARAPEVAPDLETAVDMLLGRAS